MRTPHVVEIVREPLCGLTPAERREVWRAEVERAIWHGVKGSPIEPDERRERLDRLSAARRALA